MDASIRLKVDPVELLFGTVPRVDARSLTLKQRRAVLERVVQRCKPQLEFLPGMLPFQMHEERLRKDDVAKLEFPPGIMDMSFGTKPSPRELPKCLPLFRLVYPPPGDRMKDWLFLTEKGTWVLCHERHADFTFAFMPKLPDHFLTLELWTMTLVTLQALAAENAIRAEHHARTRGGMRDFLNGLMSGLTWPVH